MAVPATKKVSDPVLPTVATPMAISASPRTMIAKSPCRSAKWLGTIGYSFLSTASVLTMLTITTATQNQIRTSSENKSSDQHKTEPAITLGA